jgi:acetolactate synthase I/II/III large subunit
MPLLPPSEYRRTEPIPAGESQVQQVAEILANASLPMIHAGGGVIHAQAFRELAELAELLHAPVTTSWSARSAIPETSPLAWPMPHIEAVTQLRNTADVVLVLGSELGETDWWGKAPYWAPATRQRIIQVDVDDNALYGGARLDRSEPRTAAAS